MMITRITSLPFCRLQSQIPLAINYARKTNCLEFYPARFFTSFSSVYENKRLLDKERVISRVFTRQCIDFKKLNAFSSPFFTQATFLAKNNFSIQVEESKDKYVAFQKLDNKGKIQWIIHSLLENLGLDRPAMSAEEKWKLLQHILKQNSFDLPDYDSSNLYQSLHFLYRLFADPQIFHDKRLLLQTAGDYYWSAHPLSVPFTHNRLENSTSILSSYQYIMDQLSPELQQLSPCQATSSQHQEMMDKLLSNMEEDAFAMHLLLLSSLQADTVIHELGCWNGQNLINLAFYTHLKGRSLAGCVGTDINLLAIKAAQTFSEVLGLKTETFKFGLAHALVPLDVRNLLFPYKKQIKLGLRLIPVLDETSIRKLFEQLSQHLGDEDKLCLSYALNEGEMYNKNLQRVRESSHYYSIKFKQGITFRTQFPGSGVSHLADTSIVLNTYFSREGFRELIDEYGFKITHSITVGRYSDNHREVCVLESK
jgi:hypothetical protein